MFVRPPQYGKIFPCARLAHSQSPLFAFPLVWAASCWKNSELAKKFFPTTLKIDGFPDTWHTQFVTSKALSTWLLKVSPQCTVSDIDDGRSALTCNHEMCGSISSVIWHLVEHQETHNKQKSYRCGSRGKQLWWDPRGLDWDRPANKEGHTPAIHTESASSPGVNSHP